MGVHKIASPVNGPKEFHAFAVIHGYFHDSCTIIQISIKTQDRP